MAKRKTRKDRSKPSKGGSKNPAKNRLDPGLLFFAELAAGGEPIWIRALGRRGVKGRMRGPGEVQFRADGATLERCAPLFSAVERLWLRVVEPEGSEGSEYSPPTEVTTLLPESRDDWQWEEKENPRRGTIERRLRIPAAKITTTSARDATLGDAIAADSPLPKTVFALGVLSAEKAPDPAADGTSDGIVERPEAEYHGPKSEPSFHAVVDSLYPASLAATSFRTTSVGAESRDPVPTTSVPVDTAPIDTSPLETVTLESEPTSADAAPVEIKASRHDKLEPIPRPILFAVYPFGVAPQDAHVQLATLRREHRASTQIFFAPRSFLDNELAVEELRAPLDSRLSWGFFTLSPEESVLLQSKGTVSKDEPSRAATLVGDDRPFAKFLQTLEHNAEVRKRWPERMGATAYRLYDKEDPDVPWLVDRYGESIHVSILEEFEWEATALAAVAQSLSVDPSRIHVKHRRRRQEGEQHEVEAREKISEIVNEGKLRFRVNLSDYLDTGLFLDHRATRTWVGEHSRGKRVLNLFAYTGAFTVHAAAGGARSSTSVDTSQVYLDWARENLQLNEIELEPHDLVRADCLTWLHENRPMSGPHPLARETADGESVDTETVDPDRSQTSSVPSAECEFEPYDLIVVDPPTVSTRRGTVTWRVQRDHLVLFDELAAYLAPGGDILFSTNYRKFELDPRVFDDWQIEEWTPASIPTDFHDRRIHRLFALRPRSTSKPKS